LATLLADSGKWSKDWLHKEDELLHLPMFKGSFFLSGLIAVGGAGCEPWKAFSFGSFSSSFL